MLGYRLIRWRDALRQPPKKFGKYLVQYADGDCDVTEYWPDCHWLSIRPVHWWAVVPALK